VLVDQERAGAARVLEHWGRRPPVRRDGQARHDARGFKWIDLSITSADNPATPVLAERLGGTIYKRWRVYRYEF
jgi:hypothetical protein